MFSTLSFWAYFSIALVLTHITIASVTLYLHRAQAHRAVDFSNPVNHFFRFWLWLTTGIVTAQWVGIHRLHHAKCETENDPHSPQIKGVTTVLFKGLFLYRAAAKDTQSVQKFSKGCPDDWLERNVYSKFPALGILTMLVVNLVLFGFVAGPLIWLVQMAWIPFWAAGVINGIGHFWGYRNYDCKDAARNISPIGWLIGGEELHNNHHAYPTSAKLSSKWYELDIGWGYIKILQFLGHAKVKKVLPSPKAIQPGVDLRYLEQFIELRLEALSLYSKGLKTLYTQEKLRLGQKLSSIDHKVWRRIEIAEFLPDVQRRNLQQVGEQSEALGFYLNMRQELIEIWTDLRASKQESLDRLKAWIDKLKAQEESAFEPFLKGLKLA